MLWSTVDCVQLPLDAPTGCVDYPSHSSVGVLAGWARRDDQGSGLRVFAGPAYVIRDAEPSGLGLTARFDGADRLSNHLSFVFWAEGQLTPAVRGDQLATVSASLGLRVR